ncbi:MAG: hypothetical protein LBG93_04990 [Treponema sp.]|jgi:hypothetical protein|nr:hypothetical protein [Treponema sp.]
MIIKSDYARAAPPFETVLDSSCQQLWERRVQYSISRIQELDGELDSIEKELDRFFSRFAPDTNGLEAEKVSR